MGAAGTSEAGSAQLLLGGPDALSPAQGLKECTESWKLSYCLRMSMSGGGSPLSMPALHSDFFSGLISVFSSPVQRLMYGRWLKEKFIALAPRGFSHSRCPPPL